LTAVSLDALGGKGIAPNRLSLGRSFTCRTAIEAAPRSFFVAKMSRTPFSTLDFVTMCVRLAHARIVVCSDRTYTFAAL
jgi:hypothetical protein